jgi:hypothetical protein
MHIIVDLNHGCFAVQYDDMKTFSPYNTRGVTSTPVKLQGQTRHAGYRTRYDRARRYNTEGQKPLPQQWHTCLYM